MREVRLPRLLLFRLARRPGTVMLVMTLVGLAWSLGPGASERAGAARYTAVQCGWKVGNEGRWQDTSSGRLNSSSWCAVPEKADPWEGIHVTSGTRASTKLVRGTDRAGWRWQAPTGTAIAAVSGDRWQVLKEGFRHRLGSATGSGGFVPFTDFTDTDTARRHFSRHFSPHASAFESRLLCAKPQGSNCEVEGTSLAGVRALTFTLDDPSRPTVEATGPFADEQWVKGPQEITLTAKDAGSGVGLQELEVAGSAVMQEETECSRKLIAGNWTATKLRPCEGQARFTGELMSDRFSDGPHTARACAEDFAGNRGCTADLTLRVDNTAPAPPRSLEVIGGEAWRPANGFSLTWEVPDQGRAAPITGARYFLEGPDGFTAGPLETTSPDSITDLQLPAPGEYGIEVWLVDAAGNEDRAASVRAELRLDDIPPTAYLLRPPAERPDLIRAPAADSLSGLEGGLIQVMRKGSGKWQDLETSLDAERGWLVADFASDSRPPGTWEVKATAVDRAGNQVSTTDLQDGSPLLLRAPTKDETALRASLTSGRRSGSEVTVRLGQGAVLTGRLVGRRGGGIPSQRIRVVETPESRESGDGDPVVRTVGTDRSGHFRLGLGPGVSRRVSVLFPGNERLGQASAGPLHLKVSAGLRFRASPRRLSTGERIRFRGQVFPGRAARAARGSLVQVQYLEAATGRWRPVLVTRVGAGGSYRASYRFRYVTGTARIRMRAVLMPGRSFPYARTESATRTVRVSGG